MIHELKIWPEYFYSLMRDSKNFEVRKDDRDYRLGDTLYLREWEPREKTYTGAYTFRRVSYILKKNEALKSGYVIMGLKRLWRIEEVALEKKVGIIKDS